MMNFDEERFDDIQNDYKYFGMDNNFSGNGVRESDVEFLIESINELMEIREKYDNIQSWFWWIKRRDVKKQYVERFMNGISEYLEEFKENK